MKGKARVNVSGKTLSWPPFCVWCLEPATKKDVEIGRGHVPYCQDCYAKVTRLRDWEASLIGPAGWIGFIVALLYLVDVVRQETWVGLLDKGNWFVALVVMGIVMIGSWIVMWPLVPIFPRVFPAKVAKPGVGVIKSKRREKVTEPSPGVKVTKSEVDVEVLEFSNPEYAKMFRKANGLGDDGGGADQSPVPTRTGAC